jgi:hypothetical protein
MLIEFLLFETGSVCVLDYQQLFLNDARCAPEATRLESCLGNSCCAEEEVGMRVVKLVCRD